MQVDDLFTKIGILVVENDMLRAELKKYADEVNKRDEARVDALQDGLDVEDAKVAEAEAKAGKV